MVSRHGELTFYTGRWLNERRDIVGPLQYPEQITRVSQLYNYEYHSPVRYRYGRWSLHAFHKDSRIRATRTC